MKYFKPKIKVKKIKLNFFNMNPRVLDSINILGEGKIELAGLVGGGCGGCGGSGCGGCGCFLKGTRIKMTDGNIKEIEKLQADEKIISYDLNKMTEVKNRIDKLMTHYNYPGGYLLINDNLKVTGNHHMWTNNNVWKRADILKVGDKLCNSEGKLILIKSIKHIPGKNTVYNLHLKGKNHNYFSEEYLVHNGMAK